MIHMCKIHKKKNNADQRRRKILNTSRSCWKPANRCEASDKITDMNHDVRTSGSGLDLDRDLDPTHLEAA